MRQQRWDQVCRAYEMMVPIAEEYGTKLMMHPADPPTVDTMFGGLGYHRLIDAFPNPCVGYLYCVGTRAEAGDSALVLDEIDNYGRKGRFSRSTSAMSGAACRRPAPSRKCCSTTAT